MKNPVRSLLLFACAAVLFLWTANPSQATTITFGDDAIIWPGWGNNINYYETSPGTWETQDEWDYIWQPRITGGSLNINSDGYLTSITVNFLRGWGDHGAGAPWGFLRPGDLFIDIGADGYWDYVFNFDDHHVPLTALYEGSPHDDGYVFDQTKLYKINRDILPIQGPSVAYAGNEIVPGTGYLGYIMSNWVNGQGDPDGRVRHPIAFDYTRFDLNVDYEILLTDALLTGWGFDTITFSNLQIYLGDQSFAFSWTQNCANDVLYQVVPEPGTLLLLGIGLGGLLIVRRRMAARS